MIYGMWLSAAGLEVNEYRQALAANNMANVDTVGFKRDLAVTHARRVESSGSLQERPYSSALLDNLSGGLGVRPTYTSFEPGEIEETGRNMDLAIDGPGFFTVSDGTDRAYTRDGRCTLNAANELVMVTGDGAHKVLDSAGQPVAVDNPAAGELEIGADGTVRQGATELARLALVDFADTTLLRKSGEGIYAYQGQAAAQPATGKIRAGCVEGSNVNPIDALTNVIEVSRAYELNARMITLQDETLASAVNRVGRIG